MEMQGSCDWQGAQIAVRYMYRGMAVGTDVCNIANTTSESKVQVRSMYLP